MRFSPDDEEFRGRVREWLAANVPTELRGAGGPGREHEAFAERLAWNRRLAAAGLTCLGWPADRGGGDAALARQVIFHEEYALSGAPARVGVVGEELLGPTLIAFGTPEQKWRFLPPIAAVEELWCQGYSEPGAGSDLAAVATTAVADGDRWVITGQKAWTSLAHVADWCFVLARSEPGSRRGAGLSYLLVPMRQPGIAVRPIRELGELVETARQAGIITDPLLRDRFARAWIGLEAIRAYALGTLGEPPGSGAESSVLKVLWSRWHQALGELAMDVRGAASMVGATAEGAEDLDAWQRLYLFSRADTIYGGSGEIQRNIIATRALGLPRQARP